MENLKPDFSGTHPEKPEQPTPPPEIPGGNAETPPFTGKDLNAVFWLLVRHSGGISIPKEVLDAAPGPDQLQVERQWDEVNQTWRIFVPRKEAKAKSKLFLPQRRKIIGLN